MSELTTSTDLEPMPRAERDRYGDRVDVLDKVKALRLLPDGVHVTTEMVANYYEVGTKAIASLVFDNRAEMLANGYRVIEGAELNSLKESSQIGARAPRLAVFNRRAVVRVGLLLRDSPIARAVRDAVQDGYEAAQVFQVPRTFAEALELAAKQARQLEATEAKVAELEPKADLAETFLIADGSSRLVREVAKLLGMREGELRRFLINEHLIFPKHAPCGAVSYDFYADFAHHFVAKETVIEHTWGTCSHYTLRITARGIELIRKRLAKLPAAS